MIQIGIFLDTFCLPRFKSAIKLVMNFALKK